MGQPANQLGHFPISFTLDLMQLNLCQKYKTCAFHPHQNFWTSCRVNQQRLLVPSIKKEKEMTTFKRAGTGKVS